MALYRNVCERYKILSACINGAFVGVMNEKFNSIKTIRINSVKI